MECQLMNVNNGIRIPPLLNDLYQYGLITTYVLLFCFNGSFPIAVTYCDAYIVSGLVGGSLQALLCLLTSFCLSLRS